MTFLLGRAGFVQDPADPEAWHLEAVPWTAARRPFRWHRCHVQSVCMHRLKGHMHCACGAIRFPGGQWIGRNNRRKLS